MKLKINRVIHGWNCEMNMSGYQFRSNGYGRRCSTHVPSNLWSQAFGAFNLVPSQIEPLFGNFIGNHYLDGAHTHEHTDPAPRGFEHVRCNVMLKKPQSGGNPVIDGEEFEVFEKSLWLCVASKEQHASTPIKGGERLIFSFGGLVETNQVERLLA